MSSSTITCPQCGGRIEVDVRPEPSVEVCSYCATVVLADKGARQRTLGRHVGGAAAATIDWVHALICLFCGGPLPEEVMAAPEEVDCAYCGHRARLRPNVLKALLLTIRRPKVAPPLMRRLALFWAIALVLDIGLMTTGVSLNTGVETIGHKTVRLTQGQTKQLLWQGKAEAAPFTKGIALTAHGKGLSKNVALQWVLRDAHARSHCDVKNITVNRFGDGSGLGDAFRALPQAAALELLLIAQTPDAQGELSIAVEQRRRFDLGYLLLLLFAFFLFLTMDLWALADFSRPRRTLSRIARAGMVIVFVLVLLPSIFGVELSPGRALAFNDRCPTLRSR